LKIVQVAHYYGPLGGIERVVQQFAHGLRDLYEVEAVVANTLPETTHTIEDGIPVTRVARLGHFRRMSVCPAFPKWLREAKPDLVHVHMTNPLAEMSFLLSGLRCKVLATYHMDVTRQWLLHTLYSPFQRLFLRRVCFITASSENFARTSPVLSHWTSKVRILPFGLAEDHFRETSRSQSLLNRLCEEIKGRVVLFVGRLIHYKGIEVLVEAMKSVEATCLVIGQGYLEGEIRRLIGSAGLAARVKLLGRIPDEDLVAYYDRADVFVLPSINRTEAYGLTQIEAMSRGTPVVCTEVGTGTSFINQHGETGLVVPPKDPTALGLAINRILRDDELRARLSEGAARRAASHFTEKRMVENLRALYAEALA
jgi:rhamnosyl/mannosyltransferase